MANFLETPPQQKGCCPAGQGQADGHGQGEAGRGQQEQEHAGHSLLEPGKLAQEAEDHHVVIVNPHGVAGQKGDGFPQKSPAPDELPGADPPEEKHQGKEHQLRLHGVE